MHASLTPALGTFDLETPNFWWESNVLFAEWIYRKTLKGGCNFDALMICSPVFLGVLESFGFGVEEVNVRTAFRCLVVACWSI